MRLHLRPIPDNVEFFIDEPGILFDGKFFRLSKYQTKMLQILYVNAGKGVSCAEIAKFSGLKITCVKTIMHRIRPIIYMLKYSIRSLNERYVKDNLTGYSLSKMKERQ